MAEKTNIERLREAWASLPYNAKAIVFKDFGYTNQGVNHILLHDRKDDGIIIRLLECVKRASAKAVKEVEKQNRKVQEV